MRWRLVWTNCWKNLRDCSRRRCTRAGCGSVAIAWRFTRSGSRVYWQISFLARKQCAKQNCRYHADECRRDQHGSVSKAIEQRARSSRRNRLRRAHNQKCERGCAVPFGRGDAIHQQRVHAGLAHILGRHVCDIRARPLARAFCGGKADHRERRGQFHPGNPACEAEFTEREWSKQDRASLYELRNREQRANLLHWKMQANEEDVEERIERSSSQVPHGHGDEKTNQEWAGTMNSSPALRDRGEAGSRKRQQGQQHDSATEQQ